MTSTSTEHAQSEVEPGESSSSRVFVRPGFGWDEQAAYLFDIDGTLLRSRDCVHYDSFFAAVRDVLDAELVLEGVTLHGNTDPGILRDAFRLAAMEDAAWRPHAAAIFTHMSERVQARRAEMEVDVMPGVAATLAHLRAQGALLGVATGNIEVIGWIKVAAAGLREWFTFGGFSDGIEVRSAMIANALLLARSAAGREATVCVVGDTPFDITAARDNGLPSIAVATGTYSFDELMRAEPDACATSLAALLETSRGVTGQGAR